MTVIVRQIRYSFAVIGAPASVQGSPKAKNQYQTTVAKAASNHLVSPIKSDESIKIEIDCFSIQDALKGIVFVDDNQVESIVARKYDILGVNHFWREPLCIIEPLLNGHTDYIFVRVY